MAKRKLKRYHLRYRVSQPEHYAGELRRWWTDEHVQEERMTLASTSKDDAWYLVFLHHDTWQKLPPRIERISATRGRGPR